MQNGEKNMTINEKTNAIAIKAKGGCEESKKHLFNTFNGYINYLASTYFFKGMDREDVIQEGMVAVIKAINSYNCIKGSFYLFTRLCIKRHLISLMISSKRKKRFFLNTDVILIDSVEKYDIIDTSLSVEDTITKKEDEIELNKYLKTNLTNLELGVLKLKLNDVPYKDIENKMKISNKSIDNAIQRVRLKIIKRNLFDVKNKVKLYKNNNLDVKKIVVI